MTQYTLTITGVILSAFDVAQVFRPFLPTFTVQLGNYVFTSGLTGVRHGTIVTVILPTGLQSGLRPVVEAIQALVREYPMAKVTVTETPVSYEPITFDRTMGDPLPSVHDEPAIFAS